ncbi:MAG: hypothetical protein GY749_01320 [Desulfobacteraceae bacterium]|nr:hypothetical protein [Desulfobacteraceae bacterium]MCP4350643.1 hypothetical protein [Desulfobacterales bacterium]
MKTYHLKKKTDSHGLITISELPPYQEVEVIVICAEQTDLQAEMKQWFDDIRKYHPFAKMSKNEILESLRITRETVWNERHESQH